VIPRIVGDSLRRNLDAEQPMREDLDAVAAKIRKHLEVAE
jgi:hypothetical protein